MFERWMPRTRKRDRERVTHERRGDAFLRDIVIT